MKVLITTPCQVNCKDDKLAVALQADDAAVAVLINC